MKNVFPTWAFLATGLLLGCGAATSRSLPSSACKGSKTTTSSGSRLNLQNMNLVPTDLRNPNDPALGIAYWDISSRSTDGTPVSRRCTATFRKHSDPAKAALFEMYTAKHCNFPPESPEFANSTSKLLIWANGGYFPVDVNPEAKKEFATFAQSNVSMMMSLGSLRGISKWTDETQTSGTNRCIENSSGLMAELQNAEGKPRVACASEDDLVLLDVALNVPAEYQPLFQKVINAVEVREKAIEKLTPRDQRLIRHYKKNDNITSLIPTGLRQFAYGVNQNFCNAPDGDPVTIRKTASQISKTACSKRTEIIELAKNQLPQYYDKYIKEIAEQPLEQLPYGPTSEIVKLHDRLYACHITSLDALDLDNLPTLESDCDVQKFRKLMWQRWILEHEQRLAEFTGTPDGAASGFNSNTYFSMRVNSLPTQAALDANDVSKSIANLFVLDKGSRRFVFDGGKIVAFSFLPAAEKMFMTQKDSGSLLYILGSIPFAALSTIDGEPTSGGASITPLPAAGSEDESAPRANQSGC